MCRNCRNSLPATFSDKMIKAKNFYWRYELRKHWTFQPGYSTRKKKELLQNSAMSFGNVGETKTEWTCKEEIGEMLIYIESSLHSWTINAIFFAWFLIIIWSTYKTIADQKNKEITVHVSNSIQNIYFMSVSFIITILTFIILLIFPS